MTRSENPSLSNSQEDLPALFKGGGIIRGVKDRFSYHRRNPSWTKTGSTPTSPSHKRLSVSDIELQAKVGLGGLSEGSLRGASSPSEVSEDSLQSSEIESPLIPEVSGISPREGPVGGGQRVVLRGTCLGECRSDVLRVVIADVDCSDTIEYHSQCKTIFG